MLLKLLQLRKSKAFALTVSSSLFPPKIFLHHAAEFAFILKNCEKFKHLWERWKKVFFPFVARSTAVLKIEISSLQRTRFTISFLSLSLSLFTQFYWTSKIKIKCRSVGIFGIFVQSSIKWRRKIARQVLRDRCKWETLIFRTVMDLVINKMFRRFCNLLQRKEHFSICRVRCSNILEKKETNSV